MSVAGVLYRLAGLPPIPAAARSAARRRLLVVCYHGLAPDDAPLRHWLLVRRSEFAAQIRFLAGHYDCLPIDEALPRLWAGELRRPTACVTFDDGYRSNLEIGLPVLRQYGVPATIYLATGLIGTDQRLWTTTIELAFRAAPQGTSIDLSPFGRGAVTLGDARSRQQLATSVTAHLKACPMRERRVRADELLARLGAGTPADDGAFALMTWDEVGTMAATGLVTFGGHTVHHEIVSQLDDDALTTEVAGSVRTVAERVPNAASRTFAYPNGRPQDYDPRAERAVAEAGCIAAVTTTTALNSHDTPHMRLRRVNVGSDTSLRHFVVATAGLTSFAVK